MRGVGVKLVIILSLLQEYSSILEKKINAIKHSCIPVELSWERLVNTELVPFSCSISRENNILGGIITYFNTI